MAAICRITIVVLITLVCAESESRASCPDTASCYCKLAPEYCSALVYAEVTLVYDGNVWLRLIGEPPHDPNNFYDSGQILEDFDIYQMPYQGVPEVGFVGLFNLHIGRVCDDPHPFIYSFVEEVDGLYLCDTMLDFPGVTKTELVPAVIAEDCRAAVKELGVYTNCSDTNAMGCCYGGAAMTADSAGYLVLAGVFLVPSRRRRRKGNNS
jgi:hypothetical protein